SARRRSSPGSRGAVSRNAAVNSSSAGSLMTRHLLVAAGADSPQPLTEGVTSLPQGESQAHDSVYPLPGGYGMLPRGVSRSPPHAVGSPRRSREDRMKVQLITFSGCPNAEVTRESLRRSLSQAGLDPTFEEFDNTAPETPKPFRDWGSPTILIDGVDVGGERAPTGPSCRLYSDASGQMIGCPPQQLLLDAIRFARAAH